MADFLHNVTDELLRRFGWQGLKDVTLVFPMHRAGVVVRDELRRRMREEQQTAIWAPETMALGDLFDSLCPLGKEDELFTVCRLYRIYCECVTEAPMEIDRFYGWGRQLLSDFTNIDQGIREEELEAFFRNALTLSDLDTYKLDDEVRHRLEDLLYRGEARQQALIADSVQAHFAALWRAMPDIYHRLRNEMQQAGKGYEGQRMRYVVSHWAEIKQRATSQTYCFIGFNYLLPVERQLMQLLQDEGRALFFWDYIENFRTNNKAFAFIRKNMVSLPNALQASTWGAPRHVRAISVTSTHAEAEYAGRWMQQTYIQKGESTAVVICDEAQLEPVIYGLPPICLPGESIAEEVNITKGYPLRHTAVFAQVRKQLMQAFRLKADTPEQALQNLVDFVDKQSVLSIAKQQNTWQWHLGREALYQTRRTLLQFIAILHDELVAELITQPELLQRLVLRHLEQLTLPFHGEPITDLQIMGVLETRCMDFKHLLLLNVEEGVIPAHQPDKSFLPYYLRKAYGLQTHDERASVYAYNFFRLLNRADDVTLLFSQSQTAMTKKSMSRFVMQMLVCPEEFTVDKYTLTESNRISPIQSVTVEPDANWADACKQQGKQLYLSPSAISTFFTCKRRFYLQYMRNLSEEDEQETIFSTRTLGLFVHEAIHYLYKQHAHCDNDEKHAVRIYPNMVEKMNTPALRLEALQEAYRKMNNDYLNSHPDSKPIYLFEQHALENRVIDTYIRHILDKDRYDAEHRGLSIVLLESKQSATLDVTLPNTDETVTITLGGRVDRMDRIGGINNLPEITRIVDYKCGTFNTKKMSAQSADLLTPEKADTDYVRQTILYSHVVYAQGKASAIEPHLYFTSQDLTQPDVVTRIMLDKKPVLYDADSAEQYTSLVSDMLSQIVAEREFTQCQKCSSYCPFLRLCNRQPAFEP